MCLVILLAFWIGLVRMQGLMATAEASRVSTVVNRITSGLMLEAATQLVGGDQHGLAALARANPMTVLRYPPANYAGELEPRRGGELPEGQWYFDLGQQVLVYRFGHPPREPQAAMRRFRTRLGFVDRGRDGRFDPGLDEFTGIALVQVD